MDPSHMQIASSFEQEDNDNGSNTVHRLAVSQRNYLNQSWEAKLLFPGYLVEAENKVMLPAAGHSCYNEMLDVFAYISPANPLYRMKQLKWAIRFDPGKYPVVKGGWGGKGDSHPNEEATKRLIADLSTAAQAQDAAFELRDDGRRANKRFRYLICPRNKAQKPSRTCTKAPGELRNESLTLDKKNQRQGGKVLAKRTISKLAPSAAHTCNVKLCIGIDDYSLFVIVNQGCGIHKYHPPLAKEETTTKRSQITKSAETLQNHCSISGIAPGQTAALTALRHNIRLTRRQVAYCQKFTCAAEDLLQANELNSLAAEMSPIDRAIYAIRKRGGTYCALFHRKNASQAEFGKVSAAARAEADATVSIGDRLQDNGYIYSETTLGKSNDEEPDLSRLDCSTLDANMTEYALSSRQTVQASDDQDLLIALVWALPNTKRLFRAFPEVVYIDGTHKTNILGQPLITVGIKDGIGQVQVVIRAYVPNERAWLFQWLFNKAIPSVVGQETCKSVCLVITDGDSTETSQLDYALETVFSSAMRRRCSWHIIEKGWDTRVKAIQGGRKGKEISECVKAWLFSLVKSIETGDEFRL
jgi:MULE transposase domain